MLPTTFRACQALAADPQHGCGADSPAAGDRHNGPAMQVRSASPSRPTITLQQARVQGHGDDHTLCRM